MHLYTLRCRLEEATLKVVQDHNLPDLLPLEADVAAAAAEAGKGPVGLSLNLAKSMVSNAIARRHVAHLLQDTTADETGMTYGCRREIANYLATAAGHVTRAMDGGAAVGSG